MKGIRFKPDCREWIKQGIKTTTFRKTRRNGLYEVVEGDIFHPKGLGIFIECKPIVRMHRNDVILYHYQLEGDFDSPEAFMAWLKANKLELPEWGWLNHIKYISDE